MNSRERQALDNYITGHYGEDQFLGDEIPDTAHARFAMRVFPEVYTYDPADDGPEVGIINNILASHPNYKPRAERAEGKSERFGRIFAKGTLDA